MMAAQKSLQKSVAKESGVSSKAWLTVSKKIAKILFGNRLMFKKGLTN